MAVGELGRIGVEASCPGGRRAARRSPPGPRCGRAGRRGSGAGRGRTRCGPAASRSTRSSAASGNRSGSRLAAASERITTAPAGIVTPAYSTSCAANRAGVLCTGESKRRNSSTAAGSSSGRRAQQVALLGVGEQGEQPVADEVDGGLVARDEQHHRHRDELLVAQPVVVGVLDQRADQRVVGLRAASPRSARTGSRAASRRRPSSSVLSSTIALDHADELVPVVGGHAEQLADDQHRQQQGVAGHEVDRAARRQGGDQLGRDLSHPRAAAPPSGAA